MIETGHYLAGVTLRPALLEDAPALAKLGRESFVAAFGYLYADEDLTPFLEQTKSDEAVAQQIADPDCRICLAFVSERLVGFCRLALTCGWPDHALGQHVVELKQLYTDPAMTRRGIGARLMDWALATARENCADEMQISVWSGNLQGQKFYARYGFAKVADVTFQVGAQSDEEFLFARQP